MGPICNSIFSCPGDHVPDWEAGNHAYCLLGMVEARSEKNVYKKYWLSSDYVDPEDLENTREYYRKEEAQGAQDVSNNCASREGVSPLASDQRFS